MTNDAARRGSIDFRTLGFYVHIPFCARRCPYCDFAIMVGAREDFRRDYVAALRCEIENTLRAHNAAWPGEQLTSIYFGGGTPSLLAADVLVEILTVIREGMAVAPDAEITLEANPECLDEAKLQTLREGGWNRLSLGAQSFEDAALRQLGRAHDGAQIAAVVGAARRTGWDNLSLDLIFAVPGQSRAGWRATLERAIELQPEHISCYSLTIEEGTPFARRVQNGRLMPLENDAQAELMDDAETLLGAAGLERYEVSNYARAGFRSRHNLNYWRGGNYLACGCGAHGHRDGHRWWNERSAARYVSLVQERGTAQAGEEFLSPRERLDERVMLGLRLSEGLNLEDVTRSLGLDAKRELGRALDSLKARGLIEEGDGWVRLVPAHVCVADAVVSHLLAKAA